MSDSLKQTQKAGDHSTNVQGERVELHYHHGLTLAEVRQEFLDLFEANFYRLQSVARATAQQRATEITEKFLAEMSERNPSGLQACQDPDMQAAIFAAQRDYARSGRQDLERLLVSLLVARSTAADLSRIVLNEAIAVASKFTEDQLDTLSLVLLFVHNAPLRYGFETLNDFRGYLNRYVAPFVNKSLKHGATFAHLKYSGCASMDVSGEGFLPRIELTFADCFSLGFEPQEVSAVLGDLLIPCFQNPEALQFKPLDSLTFDSVCRSRSLHEEEIQRLHHMKRLRLLGQPQAVTMLCDLDSRFKILSEAAGESVLFPLDFIQLTTVGIALANANVRRKTGQEFDLGHWIG